VRLVASFCVAAVLVGVTAAQSVNVEQLQAEIAALRQIVAEKSAELEKLQQQLKRLEEALQSVQKKQQDTDKTVRRFSGLTIGGYIQMRYRSGTSLPPLAC